MSEGKTDGQLAFETYVEIVTGLPGNWELEEPEDREAWEAAAAAGAAPAHERTADLLGEVNELRERLAVAERFVKTWAPALGFPCDVADPPAAATYGTGHLAERITRLAIPDEEPRGPLAGSGVKLIAAERQRQLGEEGYTAEHDREHGDSELARAGAVYALDAVGYSADPGTWPWGWQLKRDTPLRMLVKAGALIAAEIDRLPDTASAVPDEDG